MADQRFFQRAGPFALDDIVNRIGARMAGAAALGVMVRDLASLEEAKPGDLSVFADPRYRAAFEGTRASAVLTSPELAGEAPANGPCLVLIAEPRLAYTEISKIFYPNPPIEPGIDPHAAIAATATLGAGCQIDAGAVIGAHARIGARCHIGCNTVIGPAVVLGDDCVVGANATLSHALIGDRVGIFSGAVIGAQGFGFVPGPRGPVRIPQLGRVIIEDDAEIGANTTIDRGATGDTVIGAGTVIDNLVQIAHNVRIGRSCALAAQVGIAGSTQIGDGVQIGGQTAIAPHLTVGAGVRIAARSGVMRDIEPNLTVGGAPAIAIRDWHRQNAGLARMFGRRPRPLR
jgi:UDP-3-O-[3-hydroxymyristoyl] glucosamine N-acyltransferase